MSGEIDEQPNPTFWLAASQDCGITDTFSRTLASGWGTSDAGNGWVVGYESFYPTTFSVADGLGRAVSTAPGLNASASEIALSNIDVSSIDAYFTLAEYPGSSGSKLEIFFEDSYSTYLVIGFGPSGYFKVESPSGTDSVAYAVVTGTRRVRVQVDTYGIRAKIWGTGSEPVSWTVEVLGYPAIVTYRFNVAPWIQGPNTVSIDNLDIKGVNRCSGGDGFFDDFNRTVSPDSLGIASSGARYSTPVQAGQNASISVNGTKAVISLGPNTFPNTWPNIQSHAPLPTDTDTFTLRWLFTYSGSGGVASGAWQGGPTVDAPIGNPSPNNKWALDIEVGRSLGGDVYLFEVVEFDWNVEGYPDIGASMAWTIGPNLPFYIEAAFTPFHIDFRIWADTAPRPSTPSLSLNTRGAYGLVGSRTGFWAYVVGYPTGTYDLMCDYIELEALGGSSSQVSQCGNAVTIPDFTLSGGQSYDWTAPINRLQQPFEMLLTIDNNSANFTVYKTWGQYLDPPYFNLLFGSLDGTLAVGPVGDTLFPIPQGFGGNFYDGDIAHIRFRVDRWVVLVKVWQDTANGQSWELNEPDVWMGMLRAPWHQVAPYGTADQFPDPTWTLDGLTKIKFFAGGAQGTSHFTDLQICDIQEEIVYTDWKRFGDDGAWNGPWITLLDQAQSGQTGIHWGGISGGDGVLYVEPGWVEKVRLRASGADDPGRSWQDAVRNPFRLSARLAADPTGSAGSCFIRFAVVDPATNAGAYCEIFTSHTVPTVSLYYQNAAGTKFNQITGALPTWIFTTGTQYLCWEREDVGERVKIWSDSYVHMTPEPEWQAVRVRASGENSAVSQAIGLDLMAEHNGGSTWEYCSFYWIVVSTELSPEQAQAPVSDGWGTETITATAGPGSSSYFSTGKPIAAGSMQVHHNGRLLIEHADWEVRDSTWQNFVVTKSIDRSIPLVCSYLVVTDQLRTKPSSPKQLSANTLPGKVNLSSKDIRGV